MDPQFFDDLNLKNGRHTVAAGGPCHWESGDAWAEIRNVRIEQDGVVASSGSDSTIVRRSDRSWWLDATAASQLRRARPRPTPWPWCIEVTAAPTSTPGMTTSSCTSPP